MKMVTDSGRVSSSMTMKETSIFIWNDSKSALSGTVMSALAGSSAHSSPCMPAPDESASSLQVPSSSLNETFTW